ncbi:MAG: heat-inducible transcriptional repressor HrcA [Chloroflexota bacterium]
MTDLSPRRRRILKYVVEEYVRTAMPVSSDVIVRRYDSSVSTATVRNELAQLEDLGLTAQAHTSAGRTPTDAGYRFFVEHLMLSEDPSLGEQRTIQHQFHQVEPDIADWAQLASSVLANAVCAAAVVTPPSSPRARVLRIALLNIQERVVLVTVVLASGSVRQQVLHTTVAVDRPAADSSGNRLSDDLEGLGTAEVAARLDGYQALDREAAEAVLRMLEQADRQSFEDVYHEGLAHMLSEPEFASSQKAVPVVQALERGHLLGPLLSQALASDGVQVIIGAEQPVEELRETSAVLTRYGSDGEAMGVLGIFGPTRMPYWRAVPMVRFIARVMDLLVSDVRNSAGTHRA